MKKKEYIDAINEIKVSNELKSKVLDEANKTSSHKRIYSIIATSAIAIVLAISIAIPLNINRNKVTPIDAIEENGGLPTVGNFKNLYKIIKDNYKGYTNSTIGGFSIDADVVTESAITSDSSSFKAEGESTDYSKTNVQVEGVDEADIVKTDGSYIYYVTDENIVIVDARDSKKLKIASTIKYNKDNFYPVELYINSNKLVVIGNETKNNYKQFYEVDYYDYYRSYSNETYAVAKIYDTENKSKPNLDREIKIRGYYLSSRMIGSNVYLISNQSIYGYVFNNKELDELDEDDYKPSYIDTLISKKEKKIDFGDIYYFPDSEDISYLNIAGFDIDSDEEANIETYLGAGEDIYASENNLYITRVKYEYKDSKTYGYYNNYDVNTYIYKFKLEDSKATYAEAGSVPGSVLNQFSMDEKDGYFRIATTDSRNWNSETNTNNLYVLNEQLEIVGKVENLAKGEKIYSVRFMGNRAYMVTFVQTDPLFVIDLSNPQEPVVLGELKIPGYSKYLHPYDETHIIGFGENTRTNEYGGVVTDGMKMALFDVSNPNDPKELYSVDIGDKGTYSEILNNHKALLFSKEKNIIAFPISISQEEGTYRTKTIFQGAIVYGLDLEEGFKLKGTIAHMNVKDGYRDYDYDKKVERIIYIDDTLYTLSPALIKATDINTIEEKSNIEIDID